jgi:hypothetical protein
LKTCPNLPHLLAHLVEYWRIREKNTAFSSVSGKTSKNCIPISAHLLARNYSAGLISAPSASALDSAPAFD